MILLVDDNPDLNALFEVLLQLEGYAVTAVQSAKEALQFLRTQEVPELILLDCMMPGMNGEDFLHELARLEPEIAKSTQIIGFSSFHYSSPNVAKFKKLVSRYVEKPLDVDSFVHVIKTLLPQGLPA